MKPFAHISARNLQEAIDLLKAYRGKARVIAGGTDLIPLLKRESLPSYPEVIVDLKPVEGLQYIREDADGLRIGALTKLSEIAKSPIVREKYKALAEAAEAVATPQVRNMGTIGGNLCQDLRCWYYRYPHQIGGRILCYLKGGSTCYALTGDNRYHSVFECYRDANRPSACALACRAKVSVPLYLSKVREGKLDEAAELLLEANPLAPVTGRVCPHYCEKDCSRLRLDEPVAIRSLERFIGDYALGKAERFFKVETRDTGKKVAIVGSGPAGLTAAYYLRKSGHQVVVFEKEAEPGGLLKYGIPPFRLPKGVLEEVIKAFKDFLGVEFRLKVQIGKDMTLKDLMGSFDAVFIASGAWKEVRMGIPGEELLMDGLHFLKEVNSGLREAPGREVAVIGGGNVAIDVARVLLRLGAKPTVIYRRTEDQMPALKEEVEAAKEEGVKFEFLTLPIEAERKGEKVLLKCVRMKLGAIDHTGRPAPVPIEGSEFTVEYDAVIKAVGEAPDTSFIPEVFLDEKGRVKVDGVTGFVGENLFAGGDLVTGPATVVEAISAGKRAAVFINQFLSKGEVTVEEPKEVPIWDKVNNACLGPSPRVKAEKVPVSQRGIEVEDVLGLDLEEVKEEAKRCLNCGCVAVSPSDLAVALIALGAKVKIVGPSGERVVPVEDLYVTPRPLIEQDELLTEVLVPPVPDGASQVFVKFRLRSSIDFAIVSVALLLIMEDGICKDAKVVLGGVSPRPIRASLAEEALKGRSLTPESIEAASQAAVKEAVPLSMNAYKVELTKTLLKRALETIRG